MFTLGLKTEVPGIVLKVSFGIIVLADTVCWFIFASC